MNKISITSLSTLELLPEKNQGTMSKMYSSTMNSVSVIVKVPKDDETWHQLIKIHSYNLPNMVKFLGWGDDAFGNKHFAVFEKLNPIYDILDKNNIQSIVNTILITARQVYNRGFKGWSINTDKSKSHVMCDNNGVVKLIDFADYDGHPSDTFLKRKEKEQDLIELVKHLCDEVGIEYKSVLEKGLENLVETEYQSIENVHEPIYFEKYTRFLRRETEQKDPNYLKLVPANRKCVDRAEIIYNGIKNITTIGDTCIDIGCNAGYFSFFLANKGYDVLGIDYDKAGDIPGGTRPVEWHNGSGGLIDFNNLIADIFNISIKFDTKNVNAKYLESIPDYDIVLALSIVHLYLIQHKISVEEWQNFMKILCRKAKKILIVETTSDSYNALNASSPEFFAEKLKILGGFSSYKILGFSENFRAIICLIK